MKDQGEVELDNVWFGFQLRRGKGFTVEYMPSQAAPGYSRCDRAVASRVLAVLK